MKEIGAGLVRIPGLVARCGWLITVLCRYGVLIGGSTLVAQFRGSRRGRGLYDGDRGVRMLTSLGPSRIKIGELLSARRDLLSDAVTMPWPFWEFGWQPVTGGGIATVREAITTDGRRVAVKLRFPESTEELPHCWRSG